MFENVSFETGQHGLTDNVAYCQTIISNTTLIGWDAWGDHDLVRRTEFRVPQADRLLIHRPTYNGAANTGLDEANEHVIIHVPVAGGRVEVRYHLSWNTGRDYPDEVWPLVMLEFLEGVTLQHMRRQVITFLHFLSACLTQRSGSARTDRLATVAGRVVSGGGGGRASPSPNYAPRLAGVA